MRSQDEFHTIECNAGLDTSLLPQGCYLLVYNITIAGDDFSPAVREDRSPNSFIPAPLQLCTNGGVADETIPALPENGARDRSPVPDV